MAHEIVLPKASMSMEEGTILQWFKEEGDQVEAGEVLLEIETDKVSMDIEAEVSGTLLKIIHEEGDTVKVAEVVGYIGEPGETVQVLQKPEDEASSTESTTGQHSQVSKPAVQETEPQPSRPAATPLAKLLASQHNINLEEVQGSGPNGEILSQDIPITTNEYRRAMSPLRKTIAKNMTISSQTIPQVTLHMLADVTSLLQTRSALNDEVQNKKYTIHDFILAAAAKAFSQAPKMLVRTEGDDIIYCNAVNIGSAVSIEDGLVVPVIRNADTLDLKTLSRTMRSLAEKARKGTLSTEEVTGGTVTVSNLGMYGVTSFDPMINPPESAILGIGAVQSMTVAAGGTIEERKVIDIALTIDHRLIDGAQGGAFLKMLKEILEKPEDIIERTASTK